MAESYSDTVPPPEEGKNFRVWNIANVPNKPTFIYTDSLESAVKEMDDWTELQLLDKRIESNAFGIEEWDVMAEEWFEVDDWEYEGMSRYD